MQDAAIIYSKCRTITATIRIEHPQYCLSQVTGLIDGKESRKRALVWVIDKALLTVLTDKAISPYVGRPDRIREVQVEAFSISGLKKITPARFGDSRGYFSEVFKREWFLENIIDAEFVQDNESLSAQAGTVRGLHFQTEPFAQGKLVRCIRGRLLDVAVDIRTGSPTFGQWTAVELSSDNGEQLWIPSGFAHGFMTLVDDTVISYKVTAPYSAAHDRGVKWDDPAIGINWPKIDGYVLSDKDTRQPPLAELPEYFTYQKTGN